MMSLSTLKELQSRFSPSIDAEIKSVLHSRDGTPTFWGMMAYHLGYCDERLEPIAGSGGKRFRPALCLFACEALAGDWHAALPVAAAIELLHNFSLIHDDIEDGDPTRHHRPTVWRVWGEPQAINVGDGMFALANHVALKASSDSRLAIEIANTLNETALLLTEGQYMDMSFETRLDVTPDEYTAMIGRKTAALVSFSAWVGAAVAGARSDEREYLRAFGQHLGLAFQMHDDYLGVWGRTSETGKQAAQDLRKRKKTLPVLLALQQADPCQIGRIRRFFEGADDDLGVPLAVLAELEVASRVHAAAEAETQAALSMLDRLSIDDSHRATFTSLARELTGHGFESRAATVTNA